MAVSYLGFYRGPVDKCLEDVHETNSMIQRIRDHESVLGAFEITEDIQQSPSMRWRFFRLVSEDPIDPQGLVNDTGAAFYFGETLEALFQKCSPHPDARPRMATIFVEGQPIGQVPIQAARATIEPRRRSLWEHIQED